MGCDIHICAEMKLHDKWESIDAWKWDGESNEPHWYPREEIWEGRMYNLFGRLANVRAYGAPIEPKGMPDDASKPVADYWNYATDDWHTPSWLTLEELESLIKTSEKDKQMPCEACKVCKYKEFWDECNDDEEDVFVDEQIKNMIDSLKQRFSEEYPVKYWESDKVDDWLLINKDRLRIVFWFDN